MPASAAPSIVVSLYESPAATGPASLTVRQVTVGAAGGPFAYDLSSSVLTEAQHGSATTETEGDAVEVTGFDDLAPATYALRGCRAAILDGAGLTDLTTEIWALLAIGAVSVPLGLFIFRTGERYAKKHGKLKRSG